MTEKLLKVRSDVKKRKPTFKRQQTNQFAKLKNSDKWRKPKGHQSKMRLMRKGHRKMPTVGYSSPKEVRGLNKEGLREVLVYNVADLTKVDVKTDAAVVARTVGARKKIEILTEAKKKKIVVANVKDVDAKISGLTKDTKKKESKKEKTQEKKEVTKE